MHDLWCFLCSWMQGMTIVYLCYYVMPMWFTTVLFKSARITIQVQYIWPGRYHVTAMTSMHWTCSDSWKVECWMSTHNNKPLNHKASLDLGGCHSFVVYSEYSLQHWTLNNLQPTWKVLYIKNVYHAQVEFWRICKLVVAFLSYTGIWTIVTERR